jgi:hypothetical protein
MRSLLHHAGTLPGLELRPLGRQAHSQSLYRLRHPGSPWRSTGLWDVEAPIFSRQSDHRWRWGCQLYAPAAILPLKKIPGTHFCQRLSRPQGHSAAGRIRSVQKCNDLNKKWTRDLPACSTLSQPTTLPRAPNVVRYCMKCITEYGFETVCIMYT